MTRILILSDLHLCKRFSTIENVSELRPIWQGFDELILNGDTEESYSRKFSEKSQRATSTLIESAESDNVKVQLLNGNHDPMISNQHAITCHNDKVLIMHGHAVFPEVAPWTWYASKIKSHREELIQVSGDGFDAQLEATRIASDRSAKSREVKNRPRLIEIPYRGVWCVTKILHTWWTCPTTTEQWLTKYAPKTRIVIVGHTHRAGIWKIKNKIIINTGCFAFPSHPRGVVIDGNTLQVFRIRKINNEYNLDQELGSWQLDAL